MEINLEKIIESIEFVKVKTCENLPLNYTIYGETGICEKSTQNCQYSKIRTDKICFCEKKTYTPLYDVNMDALLNF